MAVIVTILLGTGRNVAVKAERSSRRGMQVIGFSSSGCLDLCTKVSV